MRIMKKWQKIVGIIVFGAIGVCELFLFGCMRQTRNTENRQELVEQIPIDIFTQHLCRSNINNKNAGIQCERTITPFPFVTDTLETILASKSIKTFLSRNDNEIVKYIINGSSDTIWYNGLTANVIISSNTLESVSTDTISVTRKLLAKQLDIPDIEKYMIASINYETEKIDSICFSIALMIPDSDIGYHFKLYHIGETDRIVLCEDFYDYDETDR